MNMFNERERFRVAVSMLAEICVQYNDCDDCFCDDMCEELEYPCFERVLGCNVDEKKNGND